MDPQRLIVTDVDGTLTGDDRALVEFTAWLARRRDRYRLAYATGRSRTSLLGLLDGGRAPRPDAIISSVGTEVHLADGTPLPGWDERFDHSHGDRVRDALAGFHSLKRQPAEAQTSLKASFDAADLRPADFDVIAARLAGRGIEAVLVYSAGRHLDVIPADAGKGIAARELAGSWGLPPTAVMAFGDSGNDVGLYREGFLGTIVGNALPELRTVVGPSTYRSPLAHAAGILDGIRHWSTG